jgi:plastocyanin
MRTTTATVAVLAALLLAGGCGSGDDAQPASSASPSASAAATASASASPTAEEGVTIDVRLTPDGPEPRGERVEVTVGEPVTLNVTSEVADEVHVHSDPEVSIDVQPGDEVSRTFTIDRPGQVAVESHATDAVVVQLVVRP